MGGCGGGREAGNFLFKVAEVVSVVCRRWLGGLSVLLYGDVLSRRVSPRSGACCL